MTLKTIAVMGLVAVLAACSGKKDDSMLDASANAGATGAVPGSGGIAGAGLPPRDSLEYFNQVVGDRVFFETDRFDLDPEDRATLSQQAAWMNANPAVTARIEGHADERGTREYNLALGARRAESVRDFLVTQGVGANRLRTVSFGKERPMALGSDPQSWAQNRRAVTVVLNTPLG